MWDVIVIGSGISGQAAAAALGKSGYRVLMLEQHSVPGGQTQEFRRGDWTFATGVHYIAGVAAGPQIAGQFGRMMGQFQHLLDWLTEGAIQFAPLANPYDIVRLPDLEFAIARPEEAYRAALREQFPEYKPELDRWFEQCDEACAHSYSLLALHSLPAVAALGLRVVRGVAFERLTRMTLERALEGISDDRLRAVLGCRWPLYGTPPHRAPFVEHALATMAYSHGAGYPVGGPERFPQTLLPAMQAGGGELRLEADVQHIIVEHGRAVGVRYRHGGREYEERTQHVIAAMSATNTAHCLPREVAPQWQQEVRRMHAGLSYLALCIGFSGDIAAAGATSANHWILEGSDIGRVWHDPAAEDAPGIFVSFHSLKDPAYRGRHTAEVFGFVDPLAFAPWLEEDRPQEDEGYHAFKQVIEARMLAQFRRHFPALGGMVEFVDLATPVTQRRFARTPLGASYGLELNGRRMTDATLQVRTPVPGLAIAGQDVFGPGIPGSFASGLFAAATVERRLWRRLLRA